MEEVTPMENFEPEKKTSLLLRLFGKKSKENDIISEIDKNKKNIIPPSEINKALTNFNEEDPELAKLLYAADSAFMHDNLREAEDFAIDALSKDKKCGNAYLIMGKIARTRGTFDEAREAFAAALKCDSYLAEACFGLGQIEAKEENYSVAVDHLQKAVNIERSHADWYAELGKAYMQSRQFSRAEKALKKAASLDFDNKEYKILATEAEEKMRNMSRAYRIR